MKVTADNYETMRQWIAIVTEVEFADLTRRAEDHPIALLDAAARRTPARARAGLGMMIGDMIEASEGWCPDTVAARDQQLRDHDLPTLSAMRLEFGKRIGAIIKRGRIRNEAEYYLARNAAELAGMPEHELWRLLEAYERSL